MEERKLGGFGFIADSWPLDADKPTIVFLHGSGGSSHFWKAQVEGLAERVNTVALDLPGHGRSGNDGKNTIGDYARIAVEFVDALDMPNPIISGLSMGGAIVQQLLLGFADRFKVLGMTMSWKFFELAMVGRFYFSRSRLGGNPKSFIMFLHSAY